MTPKIRTLTGITTTGTPHLGNYVGAIRPAIAASRRDDVESFYFLADYHALIKCEDPARIARSRLEIAATWLALGLDTDRAFFYRQSDISEIPELTWLLTCVTSKGLLNRAHAYKAAVDRNAAEQQDDDAGVTAGLFMYPVLMAADILVFNAHKVPVGRDQVQHIEMARDIAQRFNHLYGSAYRAASGHDVDPFVLPEAVVDEQVSTLPGLDGRKMSKSYDNTIPLWLPREALRKAILGIVTDSRAPGEAKDPDASNVFAIYRAFVDQDREWSMREAFAAGIGWGEIKRKLFEEIDHELAEPREKYEALIARPDEIESRLRDGARKARERSAPLLAVLREAVGIGAGSTPRKLANERDSNTPRVKEKSLPQWKRYREAGAFFARLEDENGETLIQSRALDVTQVQPLIDATMSFALHPDWLGVAADLVEFEADRARIQSAVRTLAIAREEKEALKAAKKREES